MPARLAGLVDEHRWVAYRAFSAHGEENSVVQVRKRVPTSGALHPCSDMRRAMT
jgi:hypothetical protein